MDIRGILMGLAFAAMWSSAFTSARIIVQAAPPLMTLSLRFLISGLIAVGIARALGQSWHLNRAQWRGVVIFGLCQNAIYLGLNFVAMQAVQASLAAIIASAMPLLVALLSWIVLREKLPALGVFGLVAGVAGVAVIMGARLSGGADLWGVALCGLAALSLAIATLTVRGATSRGNVLMVVGLQMFVGAAALAVPAMALETLEVTWSPALVIAFWYTVLVPGVLATLVWFLLVDRIGATKAATFHFLNPFFGVLIAWALLGEALGIWDVIGVIVIAGGILAVQLARAEVKRSA
ncbi:DMT family transporter [Roseivivax sp. THAF30]|jgi:drug/metabolite transporter (DMT)-like permease|uniref:DMT family transporter n=1 Tax=Roseivivax sp. THAF30 TaxID=2587852 RepID=UPI001268774E|nr:DMT family transporter [Roseivivax sp. THAF30]QFT61838.1 S-adenosylmethionine/S-adenosylhomocysteine transporter [Roseivivax sp. THAF30]